MTHITIIGGRGKIALRAATILAGRGDQVTSIIRKQEQVGEVAATGAEPLVADIEQLDADGLTDALTGAEVVVFSAGAGGGDPERTYAVDRDAAIRSIDAAAAAGVRHFVMVSYFGAGLDHGVPEDSSFFPYAQAKAAADEYLRNSGLAWTILGPSRLTDEQGTGSIEVGAAAGTTTKGQASRDNVAQVIAAVVANPATIGKTIEFNDGPTPIAEAF